MNLDLLPGELPVIAARLGISAEDLMAMLSSAAPESVPVPPGLDDVSKLIPAAFGKHAVAFFPTTANGVVQGVDGAAALPQVDFSYTTTDVHDGGQVLSRGTVFEK
ncbi:PE domain-containing protein [Nocardia vinacea]|uniref:PE domain-containing protein n=1 Tax=Nocardia vinacea TaxID=96468 RepID=A0ABZ1YXC5_9NOCA|nr:PE domain-containing protein [Nocardia vinacea]